MEVKANKTKQVKNNHSENNELNYFQLMQKGVEELDKKADKYLSDKEFIPNDEILNRIWKYCLELFFANGGKEDELGFLIFENLNWENLPWWVADGLDGHLPYCSVPINGSLNFSLGFSSSSFDAHLRNLLEIAEGREKNELDFPYLFTIKD